MRRAWWDRRAFVVCLAVFLALLSASAPAAALPLGAGPDGAPAELATWRREGLTPFTQRGGSRTAVTIDPATGVMWIAEGPRLRAMTWGPNGKPRHLGSTPPLWPAPTRVVASQGRVVAWGPSSPLWIVDGRDPSWPRAVSEIETSRNVRSVAFDETRVIVAIEEDLVLYDIANPSAPSEVARSSLLGHQGRPVKVGLVAVDGARVAVVSFSGELVLFDLDLVATEFVEIARMGVDYFGGITFEGGLIALEGAEGVLLVEVGEESGRLVASGSVRRKDDDSRVVASAMHARMLHIVERNYLSNAGIVRSFDVRRAAAPVGLWEWLPRDASGFGYSVPFAVSSDTLALVSNHDRLHMRRRAEDGRWDAPVSIEPMVHGQGAVVALGPHVLAVDARGGIAVQVEEAMSLRTVGRWPVVTGAEPGAAAALVPRIERLVVDPASSLAIAVATDRSESSFHLLDLSDVRAPRELVRMGASTRYSAAAFVDRLVVLAGNAGLLVNRVEVVHGLILEGVLFVEESAGSSVAAITSIGSTVWMAQAPVGAGTGRLLGIDVALPEEPSLRGRLVLTDAPVDVVASGSLLFVLTSGSPGSLLVVDASDSARPWVRGAIDVGTDPLGGGSLAMTQDGRVVVASPDRGVLVIDVRVPEHPDEVAWLEIPGGAHSVAVLGDRMWIGTQSLGLVGVRPARTFAALLTLPWLGGGR
jgi:hypothetical protein